MAWSHRMSVRLAGMVYAALLVGAGWYSYRRGRHLAPIFTVCGAVLMYVIVGESHARFDALPSLGAYAILLLTGGVTATISYQTGRPLPVMVGTLGMGLAGGGHRLSVPLFSVSGVLLLWSPISSAPLPPACSAAPGCAGFCCSSPP